MSTKDMLKLENQLCFSVYAASRSITKIYRPFLDGLGITYPQYLVLLILWEKESVTLKDLGNKLFLDSGTLTPLLKKLESSELVKRERSTEDERLLCVTITQKGKDLKEKALHIPNCIINSINLEIETLSEIKKKVDLLLNTLNPTE